MILLLMVLSLSNIFVLILIALHLRKETKDIQFCNPTQAKIWEQKARIIEHNRNTNKDKPFENERNYYEN